MAKKQAYDPKGGKQPLGPSILNLTRLYFTNRRKDYIWVPPDPSLVLELELPGGMHERHGRFWSRQLFTALEGGVVLLTGGGIMVKPNARHFIPKLYGGGWYLQVKASIAVDHIAYEIPASITTQLVELDRKLSKTVVKPGK